jgi:hypothetical protein
VARGYPVLAKRVNAGKRTLPRNWAAGRLAGRQHCGHPGTGHAGWRRRRCGMTKDHAVARAAMLTPFHRSEIFWGTDREKPFRSRSEKRRGAVVVVVQATPARLTVRAEPAEQIALAEQSPRQAGSRVMSSSPVPLAPAAPCRCQPRPRAPRHGCLAPWRARGGLPPRPETQGRGHSLKPGARGGGDAPPHQTQRHATVNR